MVDHYCAGQQAFAEGVVLFQEQDRAVTAARLLQLVSSLLHANHGTLLTYARVGDTGSELLTDQLLGVPEELMTALRAPPDWAAAQVDQPARLLQREDDGFPPLPSAGPARVLHSIVTCPLRYHGITAGVALVFNVDAQTPELPLKLATLNGLGELGAALLHRSQLEREAVFAKGLETQLAIAATIQTRLLPSAPPRNGRWTYAWRSRPSQSIGGDYLDLFDTPDQGVCAVVADVSGHGIDSALLMTSARAHFRAVAGQLTPAQALARLNDEVHREVGSTGMFVTGAALRLAGDARSLVFASAGHNPILVYRAATRAWQWLESSGPPLGFVAHAAYLDRTVDVAAGDIVVLYSDGITEAVDAQREEMFGEERLAAAVAQVATCPPDEILAHVLHMVEHFTSRSHFDDDASLVVLKA
jgi:serine phosphatase RsbU (regulator of sigma subunit)